MLLQGQTVENVNEHDSIFCNLLPGQASFHHGWTLHASSPNNSPDRRIGLNLHYLAAHVKQTKHDLDSAMCVRGVDKFKFFSEDIPAKIDLDPNAIKKQKKLEAHLRSIAGRE
jgi:ectoine hydroxylase-related dioxygenase (phytanoyl-CoA dioxygenase family)